MRVKELWRYPVKSLQGKRLREALVTTDGLDGDRRYAIFDLATRARADRTARPGALVRIGSLTANGSVQITMPDGSAADGDDALSDWLGRRVALRSAGEAAGRRYEDVVDFEREHSSAWRAFQGAPGPFHDSSREHVSLVSTQTIGAWDRRRFRTNVLLEGAGEDALVGSSVGLGEAVLGISGKIQQCVMVTRPQPGGIDRDLDVSRDRAPAIRVPGGRRARRPRRHRARRRRAATGIAATAARRAPIWKDLAASMHALRADMWPCLPFNLPAIIAAEEGTGATPYRNGQYAQRT